MEQFLTISTKLNFCNLSLSLIAGVLIGMERESRGKPVGISTHSFVIAGSMIFTYLSALVDPISPQGCCSTHYWNWFLGAGVILKGEFDSKKGN